MKYVALCLFIVMIMLGGCRASQPQPDKLVTFGTPSPKPNSDLDTSMEFALNLSDEEKKSRIARIKKMPNYTEVAGAASKLGFQMGAYENKGGVNEGSLTGLGFIGEAKQFIGDHEFRFVVMGPTKDRVDTIRVQSWGFQTKQSRQRLEDWATKVLSSLNRGQLPRDFLRQFYAGANIGNDGVFNGFCNVQTLQKPIDPERPSADDRITIDLIFDKSN